MDFKQLLYKIQQQEQEADIYERFRSMNFGTSLFFKKKLNLDDDICELLEVYTREEYNEEDKINALTEFKKKRREELNELLNAFDKVIDADKVKIENLENE